MKRLAWLICCLAFLPGGAFAQAVSAATNPGPPVEVIRYRWSHFQQGNLGAGTGLPDASARSTPEASRAQRQLEVLRQNVPEAKAEIATLEDQQHQSQQAQVKVYSPRTPRAESRYQYTLELKNTAPQPIVELSWDYAFLEQRQSQDPLPEKLRHHFVSRVKIKPGGKANIIVYTATAPYGVVSAKATSEHANERVIIRQVVYADGSVWKAP
jgi:hypothetical protein